MEWNVEMLTWGIWQIIMEFEVVAMNFNRRIKRGSHLFWGENDLKNLSKLSMKNSVRSAWLESCF
jgi:hypothetical protein